MDEFGKVFFYGFLGYAIAAIIGIYGLYKLGEYVFTKTVSHNYSICVGSNCFDADTYMEDQNKTMIKFVKGGKESTIRGQYSIIKN